MGASDIHKRLALEAELRLSVDVRGQDGLCVGRPRGERRSGLADRRPPRGNDQRAPGADWDSAAGGRLDSALTAQTSASLQAVERSPSLGALSRRSDRRGNASPARARTRQLMLRAGRHGLTAAGRDMPRRPPSAGAQTYRQERRQDGERHGDGCGGAHELPMRRSRQPLRLGALVWLLSGCPLRQAAPVQGLAHVIHRAALTWHANGRGPERGECLPPTARVRMGIAMAPLQRGRRRPAGTLLYVGRGMT